MRKILICLFITFNIQSIAKNRKITLPFSGKQVSRFSVGSAIAEDFKKIENGELNISYSHYINQLLQTNENSNDYYFSIVHQLDDIMENLFKNEDYDRNLALELSQSYREIEKFNDQYNQITNKIGILESGHDRSEIYKLDKDQLKTYLDSFYNLTSMEDINNIFANKTHIDKDLKDKLISKAFQLSSEEYGYWDLQELPPEFIKMMNKNKLDISSQVCETIEIQYEYVSEDEDRGTVMGLEESHENWYTDEDREYTREAYQRNLDDIASSITMFSKYGYGLDTICSDGKSLRELLYDYNDLLYPDEIISRVNQNLRSETDSCHQLDSMSISKDLFQSCDIAHIVWRLNREDRFKLSHNQSRIFGEGMEDCDIMIEMSVKGITKTTSLRVKNKTDTATFIGSTEEVIQMITK